VSNNFKKANPTTEPISYSIFDGVV
jgi:hypothetical protein